MISRVYYWGDGQGLSFCQAHADTDVPQYYDRYFDTEHDNFLKVPPVPTSKKLNTVAYINRYGKSISAKTELTRFIQSTAISFYWNAISATTGIVEQ